jgi:DNA-directed RNA polymerase specialized sigma24 family protein
MTNLDINKLLDNDKKEWSAFKKEYGLYIYAICLNRSFDNEEEADEMFSKIWEQILMKKEQIFNENVRNLKAFLTRLAINSINNYIRDKIRAKKRDNRVAEFIKRDDDHIESSSKEESLEFIVDAVKHIFNTKEYTFKELLIYSFYRFQNNPRLCCEIFNLSQSKLNVLIGKIKKSVKRELAKE